MDLEQTLEVARLLDLLSSMTLLTMLRNLSPNTDWPDMVCWRLRSREGSSVRKERTDRRRLEEQPRLRSEVERNKPIRRCYYITVGHHWYFYSSHSNFLCFLAIF